MARRPVFVSMPEGPLFVRTEMVEFNWHSGLAVSQKQKSIASLHEAATQKLGLSPIVEVSTKSADPLGISLSAFNLTMLHPAVGRRVSVECTFQAGKVFLKGGPYLDLLKMTSRDAKRDPRLRASGPLSAFRFGRDDWPTVPQTVFYDWLYINALRQRPELTKAIMAHRAFTDIEFNPQQSINCQAYSVALYVALVSRGLLDRVISSRDMFLVCMSQAPVSNARQDDERQGLLF
jgi:hypothetical protein